jgi:hypothetical protein
MKKWAETDDCLHSELSVRWVSRVMEPAVLVWHNPPVCSCSGDPGSKLDIERGGLVRLCRVVKDDGACRRIVISLPLTHDECRGDYASI